MAFFTASFVVEKDDGGAVNFGGLAFLTKLLNYPLQALAAGPIMVREFEVGSVFSFGRFPFSKDARGPVRARAYKRRPLDSGLALYRDICAPPRTLHVRQDIGP